MKVLTKEEQQVKLGEFRRRVQEVEPDEKTLASDASLSDEDKAEIALAAEKYRGLNAVLTDADCYRFLRARNFQLDAAVEMALHWYVWYNTPLTGTQHTPRDMRRRLLEEGDPQEEIYREHLPHANLGWDKEGRPVYWEKTGLISSRFSKIKTLLNEHDIFNRHIYQQEKMIVRLENLSKKFNRPIEKQVLVFDLANLNYTIDFMAMGVMRRVLSIDQVMYPERLKYMFFINAPWFFTAIWAAFKPFIDPVTVDKIKIIGSSYKDTLLQFMDAEHIPVEYGGTCESFGWEFPANWDSHEVDLNNKE